MAVHLATVADYLKRITALLPASGDSTVCLWAKFVTVSVLPAYQTPYVILDNPAVYTDYVAFYGDTTDLRLDGNMTPVTTTVPTAATWYHLAWVQSGTTQRFYVNGTLVGSQTYNRAAVVNGFELLGNDTFSDGNISVAYCREWTTALTAAQILVEMQATTAVHTANLYMDCPFTSTILDVSGNGHNWTQMGSSTFVTGPSLPSNSSPATATAFGTLPQNITQDFGDGRYGWFAYTGHADEVEAGFWAYADINVDTLTTRVFESDGTTSLLGMTAVNVPMQVPQTSGGTVYLYVLATAPPSVDVTISGVPGPTSPVVAGSIMINDDGIGFPLAMLSSSTGVPLQFALYPASELGEVTPDTGQTITDDLDTGNLKLFDVSLVQTATIAYPTVASTESISSDQAGLYYVGFSNNKVYTVDATGVVGATSWTLAHQPRAMAPSLDNTILYYSTLVSGSVIYRWDLVNNVALTDLVAGIASNVPVKDILVLQDDSIIVAYSNASGGQIKNYDAAGATLHTYSSFGAANRINRLTHAIDDPNSFWVWLKLDAAGVNAFSQFVNVKVSDGSFLSSPTAVQYEGGTYQGPQTASPDRFGHSNSCPFWIQRGTIVPPIPVGEPVDYIIRRERWWPHISSEQKRQFFSKLQVDLQAGNGVTAGPVTDPVQGEDPILEVDWSDDGGWTFSTLRFVKTGKVGEYRHRAMTWRMGTGRDRVYRIACSDPNQWVIINGYLDAELGTS